YKEIDQLHKESNIVAAALYSHFEQAKQKGVTLTYHIQHALSDLPIPMEELVSLIGNLLENAIDAAFTYQRESGEKGEVNFICRKQSGIWIIHCKNNTIPLEHNTIERMFT